MRTIQKWSRKADGARGNVGVRLFSRRSLAILALCLISASGLYAQAPPSVDTEPPVQPVPEKPGPAAGFNNGCYTLMVIVTSNKELTRGYVNVIKGFNLGTFPSTAIGPKKAMVLILAQEAFYGPDVQFNINDGSTTYAAIAVQQKYCSSHSGTITASVTLGPAKITNIQEGDFANQRPGMVWVTVD